MSLTNVPFTPVYAEDIVLSDLDKKGGVVLDFGCGDGTFTKRLISQNRLVYACDIDERSLELARKNGIKARKIKAGSKTPYKENKFDVVTMMGVLEHVADEKETLDEVHRILKTGGTLYIYGIGKGIFGFLDAANLKFAFPRIHKFLFRLINGKNEYEIEFIKKKEKGMLSDFTEGKRWHTHYSDNELYALLHGSYDIDRIWHYSLFLPVLLVLEFLVSKLTGKRAVLLSNLIRYDYKIDLGKFSYCFVVKCIKK